MVKHGYGEGTPHGGRSIKKGLQVGGIRSWLSQEVIAGEQWSPGSVEGADHQGQGHQAREFGLYCVSSREPWRVHPRKGSGGRQRGSWGEGLVYTATGRSSWSLSSGVESAAGSELDLSGVPAATA